MLYPNQATIELEKSFAKLKQLVFLKELNQYILTFRPFKSSGDSQSGKSNGFGTLIGNYFKPKIFGNNKQRSNVHCKENKPTLGRMIDYAKLKVNSKICFAVTHLQVRNLISFINKAQVEKNFNILAVISNPTKVVASHIPLISKKYSEHSINNHNKLTLRLGKYSTCPPKPPCYPGRHCYHKETEKAINQQILTELNVCYAYLSMACYFGRTEIALPGCFGYFMKMHNEEHEHALTFINYQIMRGGHVKLCPLTIPECQNWKSIQNALAVAVEMEKLVKEKLVELHDTAENHNDLSVMDMVTNKFIEEQERSICEMSRLLIRAINMGSSGLAEYLFDKEIHRAFVKKANKNKATPGENKSTHNLYI